MLEIDKMLTIAAVMKWLSDEVMSASDLERIVRVFETRNLQANGDPNILAGLQMRLRDALRRYFEQPK